MDRDQELKKVPLRSPDPSKWPPGIRQVGLEELGSLGVDNDGSLYWDGKPVEFRSPIALTPWQARIGLLAAVATVVSAAIDVAGYFWPWQP